LKWLGYVQWFGKYVEQHHDARDVNRDSEFGASSHNAQVGRNSKIHRTQSQTQRLIALTLFSRCP